MKFARLSLLTIAAFSMWPATADAQLFQQSPAFRYDTEGFWINLHQFLYVLGRAHSNAPDANRSAVATALPDEERGFASMKPDEIATWRHAVDLYANGVSSLDAVFDDTLVAAGLDLANAADAPTLIPTTRIDPSTRSALETAAPIYRKTYWPVHLAANRRWQASMERALQSYQRPILSFITRAFGISWPREGLLLRISAYANWAGAFSTRGPLIIISSVAPELQGSQGLETAFHEGLHQWDDALGRRLELAAQKKRVNLNDWLSHGMIFYTAGEGVRRAIPGHVPYADKTGVWARGQERVHQALIAAWRPWLDGQGASQDAIEDLVARAGAPIAPPPAPARRKKG